MNNPIPSAADVQNKLAALSAKDLDNLAEAASVPVTTLIKIRNGQTENPRIDTVHAIWPHLAPARRVKAVAR